MGLESESELKNIYAYCSVEKQKKKHQKSKKMQKNKTQESIYN